MTTPFDVPTLLAVLAAALCALAVFAPARAARAAPVSFAPPFPGEPPVERWSPPPFEDEPLEIDIDIDIDDGDAIPAPEAATWPLLIDARAFACDAQSRHDLVDALVALRAPWADAILERARAEEPDEGVRTALERALSRS